MQRTITEQNAASCLCEWGDDANCLHCGESNGGAAKLFRYCEALCPGVYESFQEQPPQEEPLVVLPMVAFGGLVEKMLTGIGITKDRVQQWTRTKDCGCAARQRWLDQWGYAQQERLERLLNRAAKFYFGGSLDAPATVAGERDADAPQATQGSEA
jgi:hypothetical protein